MSTENPTSFSSEELRMLLVEIAMGRSLSEQEKDQGWGLEQWVLVLIAFVFCLGIVFVFVFAVVFVFVFVRCILETHYVKKP